MQQKAVHGEHADRRLGGLRQSPADPARGITAIGTTTDHYVGIHAIVVPGTPRDGLYLLDGLLDPQTSVRPQQIMTDTAGYTDIMFGCYRILDFQLSPRMAYSGGARFWKLDPLADYGRLNAIATNLIDRGVIELCLRRHPPRRREPPAAADHRI